MRRVTKQAILLTIAMIAAAPAFTRTLAPSDLTSLSQIETATVSPRGQWLVWEQLDESAAAGKAHHSLWRLDLLQRNAMPGKLAELNDAEPSDPEFGADGWLYFLVDRPSGRASIYRASMDDHRVSSVLTAEGLSGYRVSPDAHAILVWADKSPHATSLAEIATAAPSMGSARVYDQLPVRRWSEWVTAKRSQLFMAQMRNGRLIGEARALAPSLDSDVPTKPNGGREQIGWAPDGQTIYFSMVQPGRVEPLSSNSDIYERSVGNGSGLPIDLTKSNSAADDQPKVSPDGRWLAWLATARPGYADDKRTVWLLERTTGKSRSLAGGWDRSPDTINWSSDSKAIFVTANDTLDHPIFSIDAATGDVHRLTGEGHVSLIDALSDGSLIFEQDGLLAPPDIWRRTQAGKLERLTSVNAGKLAGIEWPKFTRFSFPGAGDDKVWGLSLRPPGLALGRKAPVALIVHGGPQGTLGDTWYARWPLNPTLYAEHGYGVVSIDFHGSVGYGQAFTDSVNREWGGKPLTDLQLGLAAALDRFDYLDGNNACAVGASYGGFMMNWIEGHWPDRFKCLVQHDGVFDQRSMAYETDQLAQDQWDFGNKPYYVDPAPYEKWNPVTAVARWKTPQLVITGERDFRSPTGQGLAAFTALQERGIASRLLVFPDEGHYETKARNTVQWYSQAFNWIDKWTSADDR